MRGFRLRRCTGWMCLWPLMLVTVISTGASGQEGELTQREKDLLIKVEALSERVEQLEQKLGEQPLAPAQLDERITKVEKTMEQKSQAEAGDFRVYWKEGLRMDTPDERFKLKIGGRIHNDWAFFDQGDDLRYLWDPDKKEIEYVDTEDGVEFRRARIYLSGEVYDNIEFKAEYDFADGDANFKDVYIAALDLPYIGMVRAGHFKEPFSIEQLTSSNYTTFMERSLADVFAPERNTGIMVRRGFYENRVTAAVGVFRDTDNFGNNSDDGYYNVTARLTGTPWYEEDGAKMLHLGAAYSHRNPDNPYRYRQRPEAHLSPWRFADTGTFYADDIDLYNVESALVYGPFSLQGEYMHSAVDGPLIGDRDFDGYYVFASYFLTGEHRVYKPADGAFDMIKPKSNFAVLGDKKGWGAWEVALRFSNLDLSDGYTLGGEEDNVTLGLNWYLNPNTKIMLNYIHADIEHELYQDDLDVLQARFQFMF